jgi:hypothetical protein
MSRYSANDSDPIEVRWKPAPAKSRTKIFESFVGMMGRGTRWSSLAVALNMVAKLASDICAREMVA